MTRNLRVSHFIVQPVLVWDDGDELTPGPDVSTAIVTLSGLSKLAESMPAELERLAAEAGGPTS